MDNFTFKEDNKELSLEILGYEFSNDREVDEWDWLNVNVIYSDGIVSFNQTDACMEWYDLEAVIGDLDKIIDGQETGLNTLFTEPYLRLSVTKIDEVYAVQIRFVYDTAGPGWKEVYVCQSFDNNNLRNLRNQFVKWSEQYPRRNHK